MSAKVRMRLGHDESMSEEIRPFARMFLGSVCGVVLRKRGPDDHICFEIISEDDEYWFPYSAGSSSYWLPDYRRVLRAAEAWCRMKALPDMYQHHPDGPKVQYGWKFLPGTEQRTGNGWKAHLKHQSEVAS